MLGGLCTFLHALPVFVIPSDEEEEEPPHFEHFLLHNRPELTEPEKALVRAQKNKEDSERVYNKAREDYYESRHDNEGRIITIFFFLAFIPALIIGVLCGGFCGYLCTKQSTRVKIV